VIQFVSDLYSIHHIMWYSLSVTCTRYIILCYTVCQWLVTG